MLLEKTSRSPSTTRSSAALMSCPRTANLATFALSVLFIIIHPHPFEIGIFFYWYGQKVLHSASAFVADDAAESAHEEVDYHDGHDDECDGRDPSAERIQSTVHVRAHIVSSRIDHLRGLDLGVDATRKDEQESEHDQEQCGAHELSENGELGNLRFVSSLHNYSPPPPQNQGCGGLWGFVFKSLNLLC